MDKKIAFTIRGMHCASCAQTIEKALAKVGGVESAAVNFAAEKAAIQYRESGVKDQKEFYRRLKEAVLSVGYELVADGDSKPMTEKEEREKELAILRRKIVVGVLVSILLFLGGFSEWFPFVGVVPRFWRNFLLLLLTIPVQFWVGWQFYRGLALLIKYKTADMNTLIAIGTLAAFFYSTAATFFPGFFEKGGLSADVYFDTSAIIITLILVGRFLEARAKGQASEAIKKLMKLQPKEAAVLLEEGDERISKLT